MALFESGGLFARIAGKLQLIGRASLPNAVLLESIQPIVSVDNLTVVAKYVTKQLNLNVATSTFVAAGTVPSAKRWRVLRYTREATTGSPQTALSTLDTPVFELAAAQTGAEFVGLDVYLNQGDAIGMMGSNNVGDASRTFRFHYLEEDLKLA